ncbi:MAG: YqgE/AlgH family protein [Nitrospirota bacterium]|nr:MAG: YqgE/AlgH family protein [Nitrospirota bacterium]
MYRLTDPMKHPWVTGALAIGLFILTGNLLISTVSPSTAGVSPKLQLTKFDIRKGVFLVASPSLLDPSFRETVVLICDHGEEGTLGLIMNRPTNYPLSDVFPDIPGLKGFSHTLFEGGPVQRQGLLMLFRTETGSEKTQLLLDGVFWGGDPKMIASMVENPHPERQFRVFFGYAGWGRGQLEHEINGGFWRTVPASAGVIFEHDPTTLWEELMDKSTRPRLIVSYPPSTSF